MKFLDPVAGSVIPVVRAATQYEDTSSCSQHLLDAVEPGYSAKHTTVSFRQLEQVQQRDHHVVASRKLVGYAATFNRRCNTRRRKGFPYPPRKWLSFWQRVCDFCVHAVVTSTAHVHGHRSPAALTLLCLCIRKTGVSH